jgi:hypothetical protein
VSGTGYLCRATPHGKARVTVEYGCRPLTTPEQTLQRSRLSEWAFGARGRREIARRRSGGKENKKRAGTNWFTAPGTFRFASSFFYLTTHTHTHIILAQHISVQKTRLFQIPIQHVSRHLHVATMILESERGFNYTLTRDKLAMNLGSPPRRVKNVTPASQPASAPATQTKATTTRTPKPPTDTTPFPPFESPEPERYELSAESDYRVATLEAQVASLTNKGAEAGEFGCYPCLCDTSRCVCICTSLLIVLPSLSSTSTNHIQPSQPIVSPSTKKRSATSRPAKILATTLPWTLSRHILSLLHLAH